MYNELAQLIHIGPFTISKQLYLVQLQGMEGNNNNHHRHHYVGSDRLLSVVCPGLSVCSAIA